MKEILRELRAALADAAEHGDWNGHLRAWWRVARGRVRAEEALLWPTRRGMTCLRNR